MTHKNLGTLPSTSWRNSVCSCCLFGEPTEIPKSTNQGGWGLGRVGTAAQRQLQKHGCNCSNLLSLCENERIDLNSRRIPLHLSSCYCYGYRSWEGPCVFQGFVEISIFEIQHETKIHSLTGSEMDRGVVLLVSGASATLHVPFRFHFAFICMHVPFILHSLPFIHVPFIFLSLVIINLPSCSFHIPSMFIPMCIHVLSFSSHVHAFPLHFAFVSFSSFLKLWKWLYDVLARGPSATNGCR